MSGTPPIRAIFFDIDGTLLSPRRRQVPESALRALRIAHDAGILLFPATGRHRFSLERVPDFDKLPFDGFVCLTGQYCSAFGKTVFVNPVPKEDIAGLIRFVNERADVSCQFSCEDEVFANRGNHKMLRVLNDKYGIINPPDCRIERALEKPVLMIELFFEENAVVGMPPGMPSCRFTRWNPYGIDILNADGGKWVGIRRMARHLDLPIESVAVFGDNDNDLDMLENAAWSVALGDGTESARAAAKMVTAGVDEDGVALAMKRLLPGLGI